MRSRVAALVAVITCSLVGVAGGSTSAGAAPTGSPVGAFTDVSARFDDRVVLSGFALDPDAPGAPVTVHFYVGSTFVGQTTTTTAPGVATPIVWSIGSELLAGPPPPGSSLCAYGINVGPGSNALLGCRDLRASGASAFNPVGALDAAIASPALIQLRGWAGDPDGDRTTQLRVYYDGVLVAEKTAGLARPDVQAAIPAVGPTTGFNFALPIAPGRHQVCVYAQNTGLRGASNSTVGCITRTVPGVRLPGAHDPIGAYDSIGSGPGSVFPDLVHSGSGWVHDPDSGAPVQVLVRTLMYPYFVDPPFLHQNATLTSGQPRPDVFAAFPAAGPNSGFSGIVSNGSFSIVRISCAYARNLGPGSDRLLGCAAEAPPPVPGL